MNMHSSQITLWQLFLSGGPIMWPLLLCSMVALTVVLEKMFLLVRWDKAVPTFIQNLFANLEKRNLKEALMLCDAADSPMAEVLKAGILQDGRSKEAICRAMDTAARLAVPVLEQRLSLLAGIGSVAPLLGLLGTVVGLCIIFQQVQVRAQAMNPITLGDIAGGGWSALITTVFGLLIMISVLLAYNVIQAKILIYVHLMEKKAAELADFLAPLEGASTLTDED